MRVRVARFVSFAAGAVLTAAPLAHQTPPPAPPQRQQTPPVFRGGTDLVELDVSVLDKKRKPVHGLVARDFTMLEDGVAQRIDAVSEIAFADADAPPPVWARAVPPDVYSNEIGDKRLFAILVEAPIVTPPVTAPMPSGILSRRADPALVDQVTGVVHGIIDRLGPGDMAALIGPCSQPFTDDRDRLHAAIESVRGFVDCPLPPGGADRHYATDGLQRMPHLTIAALAEYLAVIPQRRKAIIYVGRGPGIPLLGSRGGEDLLDALWFAQQANVNIYSINPYSLDSLPSRMFARTAALDGMRALPDETGGFAVTDPEKDEEGLEQIFTENRSYYMIGYHTTHPAMDGKFRRLSVRVAGPRDRIVRTRPVLYRPKVVHPDAPAPAARPAADVPSRVVGLLPDVDVRFEASVLPFVDRFATRTTLAIVTEVTEPVTPGATHIMQTMDLRILAYDERGEVRGDRTEQATLDQPPSTPGTVRYGVLSRIDVPPGRYTLRIVAHNAATNKVGNVEVGITAPDFVREPISISGLAIVSPTAAASPVFGTLDALIPVTPTATRTFWTNDHVTAFGRVYEGGTDPIAAVTMTTHLLDAAGKAVFDAAEAMAPDRFFGRAADYRLALPIERLRTGPYLLTMEASMGARRTPRRDVRFAIR